MQIFSLSFFFILTTQAMHPFYSYHFVEFKCPTNIIPRILCNDP
uniref:Uncharacterized protein n=1 Tax=Arundo donax TaxID=35708 RepID=A0A0A9E546_ARUDO